jgi:hypothetical protein
MLRYQSRRHQRLMDESERALSDEAEYGSRRESRIAREILGDSRNHRLWESRHADLILPLSEQSRRAPQIFALRDLEVRLLHRRALIRHIRWHGLVGDERDKLFSVFYGPRETTNAILAEHRQYSLAVSSRVSADHLIGVMEDPVSTTLLREYERIYTEYFELYCFIVGCDDAETTEAAMPLMLDLRRRAFSMIKRIHSEKPEGNSSSIERQALLARSGRYPIRNYMVG